MAHAVDHDIHAVQSLTAVPTIMQVIAHTTGLRWICVSRVTQDAWTMCAVRDELDFGLAPGDEIAIADTFCDQVRRTDTAVVIDAVSNDPLYHAHPIPKNLVSKAISRYRSTARTANFSARCADWTPGPPACAPNLRSIP